MFADSDSFGETFSFKSLKYVFNLIIGGFLYIKMCPETKRTHQMEHFLNASDLFHISIWKRAHRRHLKGDK